MIQLTKDIEAAVSTEYERAAKVHGAANNSPHESYAVILEEYEEAKDIAGGFGFNLEQFWNSVKNNNPVNQEIYLKNMEEFAMATAAEWVQVAAMCQKAMIEKVAE